VDVVKIDRSFVAEVVDNRQDAELVRAIVKLSSALGYDTVAEGVETVDQAKRLRMLGCRLAQGYVYSKPTEAAELFTGRPIADGVSGAPKTDPLPV
jgi:EAL domain-containing protein (putative c-di-GMP-specific phosphodiesterase class I)